jgi:hypothetical protein
MPMYLHQILLQSETVSLLLVVLSAIGALWLDAGGTLDLAGLAVRIRGAPLAQTVQPIAMPDKY